MAEQHGGRRTPSNPAPVAMPGALSRRTDGGPSQSTVPMTGMGYGENADYNDIQSSAPMAAAPTVSNARVRRSSPTGQGAAATPLFAPTAMPDEPVTAGAPVGPGPGPMDDPQMGMQADVDTVSQFLPSLMRLASQPDAPTGFVRFVRHLRNVGGGRGVQG
jgi:hypothetical protein